MTNRRPPNARTWYHGSKDPEVTTQRLRPLYLTTSPALASLHGNIHRFEIRPGAKWVDICNMMVFFTMDSLGYEPASIQKMKRTGADVVWDSSDFRRAPQVFVINPRVLTHKGTKTQEGTRMNVNTLLKEALTALFLQLPPSHTDPPIN